MRPNLEKPKRKTFPNDPWSTSAILKFNTAEDSKTLFEVPINCSVAAAEFLKIMTKGVALFIHLVKLSTFSDNAAFVAHQLINEGEALPKNYDPFVLLNPSSGHFTHQTRKLADDLLESSAMKQRGRLKSNYPDDRYL